MYLFLGFITLFLVICAFIILRTSDYPHTPIEEKKIQPTHGMNPYDFENYTCWCGIRTNTYTELVEHISSCNK